MDHLKMYFLDEMGSFFTVIVSLNWSGRFPNSIQNGRIELYQSGVK